MNAYEERMHDIQEAREQGEKRGRTESLAEGEKIGEARGEASGRAAERVVMAKMMKADNEPTEKIAKYTGLSREKIELL